MGSLSGRQVGVTAARKAEQQVELLERRGAEVRWAPALSLDPNHVDDERLRAATDDVLAEPVDLLLGTTGVGLRAWFDHAEAEGRLDRLLAHLDGVPTVARGAKTVGALRRRGLAETWVAPDERLSTMLDHVLAERGGDLSGVRVVLQEHGQDLTAAAEHLRAHGAHVRQVAVYRVQPAEDLEPLRDLVRHVAAGHLHAVTFTSPPAVAVTLRTAEALGLLDDVRAALAGGVHAVSVGPVTAEAFEPWRVATTFPDRSRLAAMVAHVEQVLAPVGAPVRAPGEGPR